MRKFCVSLTLLGLLVGIPGIGLAKERPAVQLDETFGYGNFSAIDKALARDGVNARLYTVEYITSPESGHYGGTIFARNVGNKQLPADWVPGDPNRYGVNDIYWTTDQVNLPSSVFPADMNAAIDSAMNTWDQVHCSTIPLTKINDFGTDWGYVQYLLGFGGVPGWLADFTHAGWLRAEFFDAIEEEGSSFILGVTFTFIWRDGFGMPTDIDGNKKLDVAFRETYYNDSFEWSVDAPEWFEEPVDVETIVLHESGHGLSQAHFGKMFIDASQTEPPYSITHLHFAPRAVMNSVYWGTLRELQKSDVGGHCSIWASWPEQ
jgi:hypothetical protein